MKTTSKNKRIQVITKVVLIIYLVALSLSLFSCTKKDKEPAASDDAPIVYALEKGTKIPESEYGSSIFTCGYRSEKEVFDMDNVSITVFFGGCYDDISQELEKNSFPNYYISLSNEKGHTIVLKTVYEEFISEKYRTTWTYSFEDGYGIVEYNHFETITIPKQLFVAEKGTILFTLGYEYMYFAETTIYYEKIGNTIRLSSEEIK